MTSGLSEFSKEIRRVSQPRTHKAKDSMKLRFFHQYYNNNRPQSHEYVLSRKDYSSIIIGMNTLISDRLIQDRDVLLPAGFGTVSIVKIKNVQEIDSNGNLVVTNPIDMKSTIELWHSDEESFESKTVVRFEDDYRYKIKHNKSKSRCKNLLYFKLRFNRAMKIRLMNEIKNNNYDTYELIKMNQS